MLFSILTSGAILISFDFSRQMYILDKNELARLQQRQAYLKRIPWYITALASFILSCFFFRWEMTLDCAVALILATGSLYIAVWCLPSQRKFEDDLPVYSTTSGTQFVNPVELILREETYRDLRLCFALFEAHQKKLSSASAQISNEGDSER
jgi:hypothetical protein